MDITRARIAGELELSTENLKCSEAGTDHLCPHLTQAILAAGLKNKELTLLKKLCQTSRRPGRTILKGASLLFLFSGEGVYEQYGYWDVQGRFPGVAL